MTHPPIPPKSSHLFAYCGDESVLGFCWIDPNESDADLGMLQAPIDDAHQRHIIAAVAEVEWRRRAERWESLALHYYNDFHPCVREQYFWDMHGIARRNADAWRAWGEGK